MQVLLLAIIIASIYAEIPSEMMAFMDSTVHPCDDFYQYACGGWIQNHYLNPSVSHIDSTSIIEVRNANVLMEIIDEKHPVLSEIWESCMAFDQITQLGNKPLQKDLNLIYKAQTHDEIIEMAGTYARTGTDVFFKAMVAPDLSDSRYYTLHLQDAELTLPNIEYYSDDQLITQEYKQYINNLIDLSGFSNSRKRKRDPKRTVADIVISIEKQIAFFQKHQQDVKRKISIDDGIKYWPMTFGSYLKDWGLYKNPKLAHDLNIYIRRTSYFYLVEQFIRALPLYDLKVYIAFRMVHSRVHWLGEDFYKIWFKLFRQRLQGQQVYPPRRQICRRTLLLHFPDLVGKYYYTKAFDSEREKNALEMIWLIQDAMEEQISQSTWLDTDTKKAANKKLRQIKILIGQPKKPRSYLPSYRFSTTNYPENMKTILLHSFDVEIKKIGQLVDRSEWSESAATPNAFYIADRNTLMFPAGFLQPPLFHGIDIHPARNFGAIGAIMGHELTHGFDNDGRLYDGQGNANNWWSESTMINYRNNTKFLRKQYSAFKINGQNVNGWLTLNENIADNGGVALAWSAYRKYMTKNKSANYGVTKDEADQMFFLALGQMWCEKGTNKYMQQALVVDVHSPGQCRLNGVVMNNKNFAKVFKCEANAPMNPSTKYSLW